VGQTLPGGKNANAVTSQAVTDLGNGATFYDVLVDVARHEGACPRPDLTPS
jgi:hypothetical protein